MRTKGLWLIGIMVLLGGMLILSGCDSSSSSDSPTTNTLIVTANPGSISTSGSSVVEAVMMNGATPVAGVDVAFTVAPSSAGYFTPTTATTDADGIAATVFTALNEASATITATAATASLSDNANLVISTEGGGGSGTGNVTVSVSPSLIIADATDSAQVTIAVRDALGATAPDSTLVKVVAGEKFADNDGNGYWTQGVDSLLFDGNENSSWDAMGVIASTVKTKNGNGSATLWFKPGTITGTAYIRATVSDGGISGYGEASVQIRPNAEVYSIYLMSDTNVLQVRATGGIETGLIRATLYDVYGNLIPEGVVVNFAIVDGPGGDEWIGTTAGDSVYSVATDVSGRATAPIHSGTKSGTIRVRAWSNLVLSSATQILVASGPPKHIVVGAEFCNVDYWDNVGQLVKVAAVVSDTFMNPVPDSTVVYFTCDEGTMKAYELRTLDHEGIATTLWISGTNIATADGRVYIIAETYGGKVADTSMFFNSHICDTLMVTGVPAQIYADGASKYSISVIGLDLNDNPVANATEFKADARLIGVTGGTLGDGCYSSWATVKLTAPTLQVDNSNLGGVGIDDGIGDVDQLLYWSAGAVTRINVTLQTGMAYAGNSDVEGSTSASNGENLNFTVTVKDRWGNPLADHTITLSSSSGTVVSATHDTDPYGVASGFIWTAPAAGTGDFNINFTDSDPRGSIALSHKVSIN